MMARRLLVDTDGGTDDALALALLVALGRAPAFVTTSFGNVALDQATDNILATLAILGCDAPVHAGAARPLIGAAIDAADVHGEDGLGGAPRPAKQADVASRNGVDFLRTVLREAAESEEPIDILALGPLTNLALAFAAEPAIAAGVGELVIMGGTVFGRGNVTGAAEFNILADPEAAAMVLALPLPTVMVPWEPCVEAALAGDDLDALFASAPAGPRRDFLLALSDQLRRVSIGYGEGDRLAPADPLAAAVLVERSIATATLTTGVAVECGGAFARGATILDLPRKWNLPPVTVVEHVDPAAFRRLFAAAISAA
ncbi:MAG: nucleoside hydrolase [Bosea sp.]|nr:nucleoside hydrolase [Bosea sp. (in: a-proteobacteria)]